jgi:hypothetical protein
MKFFIMEKRNAEGKLDLSDPQPPFLTCTEEQITRYYFANCGHDRPSAGQEEIREWYAARGFSWREKTW